MIDFDAAKADIFVDFKYDGETYSVRKMRALSPAFVRECGDLSTMSATDLMSKIMDADGGDGSVFDRMPMYMSEAIFKEIQGGVSLGE